MWMKWDNKYVQMNELEIIRIKETKDFYSILRKSPFYQIEARRKGSKEFFSLISMKFDNERDAIDFLDKKMGSINHWN